MDEYIILRDGTEIPVPPGTDPRVVQYVKNKYADYLMPDPTTLGAIGQGLAGIPRGFLGTLGLMGRGVAQLVPGEGPATDALNALIERTQVPRQYEDSFIANLGQGIGSIGGFALPAIATGGLGGGAGAGLAASATAGALSGAGEQGVRIDALQEQGREVSPDDEFLATLLGLGIGSTEAAPIGRIASRFRRAAGIGARTAQKGAETLTRDATEGALMGALKTGVAEGTQEVLAGAGQNAVARYVYNPEQEITPSMMEFTVGGTAGAIFDLIGSAAARRAGRIRGAADYLGETQKRMARLSDEGPIRFDQILGDAEQQGAAWTPEQYARDFDILEVGPGQYQLVDTGTNEPVTPVLDQQQAEQRLAAMDQEVADQTVAAFAIARARALGRASDPASIQALQEALHPDTRELPITSIARVLANESNTETLDGRHVFMQDPQSRLGVMSFRRGFNRAEQASLDEAMGELATTQEQVDEARARVPTYRARPVNRGAVTKERDVTGSRTGQTAGRWVIDVDGTQYRAHKWGSAGWAVYAPGQSGVPLGFGRTLDGQDSAVDFAVETERDERAKLATDKRAAQQKYIDRVRKRREKSLAAARERVMDRVKKVEDIDPEDQPRFDLLARYAEDGRLTVTPAEARRVLSPQQFDDLMFNMAGMAVTTQTDLMRQLRETATKQGKPRARRTDETIEKLREIAETFLAEAPDAEGALIKMDKGQEITAKDLVAALKANGWKATEAGASWRRYAEALLGREIKHKSDLTKGESAYLLSRFSTMAMGSDGENIRLPDPSPITYTNQQKAAVINHFRARAAEGQNKKQRAQRKDSAVGDVVQTLRDDGVAVQRTQVEQAINDLVEAGILKATSQATGVANGIAFDNNVPTLEREGNRVPAIRRRAQRLARRVHRRMGREGDPSPGLVALAEESLATATDMVNRQARQAREQAAGKNVDEAGIRKAAEEAAANMTEAEIRMQEASNRLTDRLAKALRLNKQERNALQVKVVADGAALMEEVGRKIANPDTRAGVFDTSLAEDGTARPYRILLNLKALDVDPTVSVEEMMSRVDQTVTYETVRFLFEEDYITQTEKDAAYNAASRFTRPDGRTYREAAEAYVGTNQPDVDPASPAFKEYVTEQAMAEMALDYQRGVLQNQIRGSRSKGLMGKIWDFIKAMASFQRSADMRDTLDLLDRITNGGLSRRPGLGRIDRTGRAEVRSLRETALDRPSSRRRPGVAPPDDEGAGPPPEASPATESGTPEGAEGVRSPTDPPASVARFRTVDPEAVRGIDPADIEVAPTYGENGRVIDRATGAEIRARQEARKRGEYVPPEDSPYGYYYHVTHSRNAEAILEEGFDHGVPTMGRTGFYPEWSRGKTFFTEAEDVPRWYATMDAHIFDQFEPEDGIAPVVLRISKDVMPPLREDTVATGEGLKGARFAPTQDVMSPERRAELEAQRDASIEEDLRSKIVPKHGPNLSAEGMDAYNRATKNRSRTDAEQNRNDSDLRFRTIRDEEGVDPLAGEFDYVVEYEPEVLEKDFFTRFLDALKTMKIYDFIREDGVSFFNDIRKRARAAILDGRNELDVLTEMFRDYQRDNAGIEMLADMQAIHSFRTADRMMQLISQAVQGGVIRYVQGERDSMGRWQQSNDPLKGHFVVDRGAPITTSSGVQFDSVLDILRSVYSEGKEGERRFHDYLAKKRILAIIKNAEEAKAQLARGEYSEVTRQELERRAKLGEQKNLPGKVDPKDVRRMVEAVESRESTRWMVDAAEALTAWNDSVLQMLRDTGVLSEEKFNAWKGEVYVGFTKGHQNFVKEGVLAANKVTKNMRRDRAAARLNVEAQLTGSDKLIDQPLYTSILENFEDMVHDAIVNTGHARVVQALNTMKLDENGVYGAEGKELGKFISREQMAGEPWVIRYFEDGEEKLFRINVENYPEAPELIASMQFSGEDFYRGALRALPAVANLLRQGVTRMPDFVARNLFKDAVSIYVTSGSDMTPVVGTFKNFAASAFGTDKQAWDRAREVGLAIETDNLNDRNRHGAVLRRMLEQRDHDLKHTQTPTDAFLKAWGYLGDLSSLSDIATRMEVYDDVLAKTGNHAEATKQALEVINYGRRGRNPVWRLVTASIPFLNARIQGLDVLWRGATGRYSASELDADGKRKAAPDITRAFLTRGAYLMALTGAYYMLVRDEDWYKNLRDEVKDDYWLMPVGGGQAVKIPVPFEVGLLFKTLPEQVLRWMDEDGYTGTDFANSFVKQATQTTMFSPAPQLLAPLFDVWRNYNSFTRSPITPTYMEEGLPYMDRVTANTTTVAKMGSALLSSIPGVELDPMRVEYLATGYFGTIGNYLLQMADWVADSGPAREIFNAVPMIDDLRQDVTPDRVGTARDYTQPSNIPGIGGFVQDLTRGGGYQQDFYELRRAVNQAVAGINQATKEGRLEDARSLRHELGGLLDVRGRVRALDRYVQNYRDQRDRLLQSDMPPAEKRERLRILEVERDLQLAIVPFLREVASESR